MQLCQTDVIAKFLHIQVTISSMFTEFGIFPFGDLGAKACFDKFRCVLLFFKLMCNELFHTIK